MTPLSFAFSTREQWLEWRRGGIGSSDAPAIAGLSPWRGPLSVWLEKTGRLAAQDADPEYQMWGRLLEPAIADEFERRMDVQVVSRGEPLENAERPWQRATVDGLVMELGPGPHEKPLNHPLGLLEIKTSASFKTAEWAHGAIPEDYQIQVQHQLSVTGLERAWIAALLGGQKLVISEIERNEPLIASLVDLEAAFWERVQTNVPPAADGFAETSADLRRAFSAAAGEPVALPDEAAALIEEQQAAWSEQKAAERRQLAAEQALMVMLGEAQQGTLAGRVRVTWKRHERKAVDLDGLRAKHPKLVARFTSPGSYRVMRFPGKGGEEEG